MKIVTPSKLERFKNNLDQSKNTLVYDHIYNSEEDNINLSKPYSYDIDISLTQSLENYKLISITIIDGPKEGQKYSSTTIHDVNTLLKGAYSRTAIFSYDFNWILVKPLSNTSLHINYTRDNMNASGDPNARPNQYIQIDIYGIR